VFVVLRITALVYANKVVHVGAVRSSRPQAAKWKRTALAAVWVISLALGLTLAQLEIFLIIAPLSAGIYLLSPDAV